jgi:hypothetical protein
MCTSENRIIPWSHYFFALAMNTPQVDLLMNYYSQIVLYSSLKVAKPTPWMQLLLLFINYFEFCNFIEMLFVHIQFIHNLHHLKQLYKHSRHWIITLCISFCISFEISLLSNVITFMSVSISFICVRCILP